MQNLEIKLRMLEARFEAQRLFSLNNDMIVAAKITEAEIKELKSIINEQIDKPNPIKVWHKASEENAIDFAQWFNKFYKP